MKIQTESLLIFIAFNKVPQTCIFASYGVPKNKWILLIDFEMEYNLTLIRG